MAKPGKHTFPDYDTEVEALAKHLPSAKREAAAIRRRTAIRKRTAREIKASALTAETLRKQTAREMREGARQAKKNGKKFAALLKKAAAERADTRADTDAEIARASPALLAGDVWPDEGVNPIIPAPRQVRLAAAIANAYYRPDDPTAVTVLRIKRAIVDLNHVMTLLDDLYPI